MCLRKRMGLVVAIRLSLRLGSSGRNWGRGFLLNLSSNERMKTLKRFGRNSRKQGFLIHGYKGRTLPSL